MPFVHHKAKKQTSALSFCQALCMWAWWIQAASAWPEEAIRRDMLAARVPTALDLIPSAPRSAALIPSEPPRSDPRPSSTTPSQNRPSGLIPSGPPGSVITQPAPGNLPSPSQPGLIPSAPAASAPPSGSGVIPSLTESKGGPMPSGGPSQSISHVTVLPSMASTEEGLKPIPAPTTATGNPDGHHEIPEPNFTVTQSCRGCSPVIEITATGWGEPSTVPTPIAEHVGTTALPPVQATITAGSSPVIISQNPAGSGFVIGGSTTVNPGQTVIIDNTPIVIQTSSGKPQVVVGGTKTIALNPQSPHAAGSQITEGPILLPVTIGSQTITADAESHYIIGGQTLHPGGSAITVDGTTVSLMPSATAIVVNGVTSTLAQAYGAIYTTTAAPLLTLNGQTITANRAGYYVLAPGTTLIPGGPPVTMSGTTISLDPRGTAAIIQGSTSNMAPITTIVTQTRNSGQGNGGSWSTISGGNVAQSTGKAKSAGVGRFDAGMGFGTQGWFEGTVALLIVAIGWLAVGL